MLLWHFERERPSTEFIIGVIIVRCISHDYTCNLLEGKNVWKKMQNCWKYHHKTYNKSFIFNICFAVSLHGKLRWRMIQLKIVILAKKVSDIATLYIKGSNGCEEFIQFIIHSRILLPLAPNHVQNFQVNCI